MKKHEYEVVGDFVRIFIKYNGETYEVKIDKSDLYSVIGRRWHILKVSRNNSGTLLYAQNRALGGMHRHIMEAPKGLEVDHINHDTLDNRKSNLRVVTSSENKQNLLTRKNSVSGVRGIRWSNQRNKWQARFQTNGKEVHVGFFDSIEEAEVELKNFRSRFLPYSQEALNNPNSSHDLSELKDRLRSDNTSGIKGIDWEKRRKYWRVRYKEKQIGTFKNLEEAKSFLEEYKKNL